MTITTTIPMSDLVALRRMRLDKRRLERAVLRLLEAVGPVEATTPTCVVPVRAVVLAALARAVRR